MVTATMTAPAEAASGTAHGALNGCTNGAVSGAANGTLKAAVAAAPKRMYVTYDAVHSSIAKSVELLHQAGWATPDYLLAISGGGLIPARILRSMLRSASNNAACATIKVIGLELYNDEMEGQERDTGVIRTQWLELQKTELVGKRILIVDEVDDSRQTLEYAVRELQADIQAQEAALAAEGRQAPGSTHLGVFVVHNKLRPKKGVLPEGVPQFVAHDLDCNPWLVYPWDAVDIHEHNRLGHGQ